MATIPSWERIYADLVAARQFELLADLLRAQFDRLLRETRGASAQPEEKQTT